MFSVSARTFMPPSDIKLRAVRRRERDDREAVILDESQHTLMRLGDADGAGLAELAFAERLANGLHPSARICARFENDNRSARFAEKPGRVETGEATAR